MISIKLKASVVSNSVQNALDYLEELSLSGVILNQDTPLQRLYLIQSMLDSVDPDSLVTVDEEAYQFIMM